MLHSFIKISVVLVLIIFMVFPILTSAETTGIGQALEQIQSELSVQNTLTQREIEQVMSKIRNSFEKMNRAGVEEGKIQEMANQACQMVREMTKNAGDQKKLDQAVSLMARETMKGKNPTEVGEKICQNLRECDNLNKALKQTKAQIREQDRIEQKTQSHSNEGTSGNGRNDGNKSGSGNGGNGGNGGSNGGGGKGK